MNDNPFSLKNKVIVITGASSGIGRQCAISCSHFGATVVLLGRNESRLEETLGMMNKTEEHIVFSLDLLDNNRFPMTISDAVEKRGKIDGVINCAGISTTLPFNAISSEKMEKYLNSNVIGPMGLTNQILKSKNFSSNGGSVVFISSVMGVAGTSGRSLYSMTKGALLSASKSLSIELAPRKIRVNCVSPGVVKSPMSESAVYSRKERSLKDISEMHPLGLGKSEDVANACIYLLSDASSWVTGTNLVVDGGYLAK